MNKWISVGDRLPEEGTAVMVYGANGYCIEEMSSYDVACMSGEEYDVYWSLVSHWMPLSKPGVARGFGLTPRGEPMPQTIEEWRHLVDLDEEAMIRDKVAISKLKVRINILTQRNSMLDLLVWELKNPAKST